MEFEALGTHWWIESADVSAHEADIHQVIDRVDRTWSRFRDDSLVASMAQTAARYPLDAADIELMKWYQQLYNATDGLMTPLIGQTLSDAGYDKDYSLQPVQKIQSTPGWDEIIEMDTDSITLKKPRLLDVGAAGKGYAVDQVAELLDGDFCVDAGGDMMIGDKVRRIGLEDPRDPSKLIGVADISHASICGSGIGRRAWQGWHHVIDPKSARPVDGILATWAISDSAMHADGLATALFFVPPEQLASLVPFQYCIMYNDGTVRATNSDSITIFTEKN